MDNSIKQEFGPILVDRVMPGMSESTGIAVLKQEVKSIYPAARGSNDKVSNIFGAEEFGTGQEYVNTRWAIIKVPKGVTPEQVQAKLAQFPNAKLYRILSLNVEDTLTQDQKDALESGLSGMTIEDYKNRNLVVHPETNEPILYNGQPQYRAIFFDAKGRGDEDLRPAAITATAPERVQVAASSGAQTPTGAPVGANPATGEVF